MAEIKFRVKGMVCEGCKKRVENVLNTIDGVTETTADYNTGVVIVKANKAIDLDEIERKIQDIGFEVRED